MCGMENVNIYIYISSVLGTDITNYVSDIFCVKSCNMDYIVLKVLRGRKATVVLLLLGSLKF